MHRVGRAATSIAIRRARFDSSCYDGAVETWFALFDTAIGRCAISWGGGGVAGVQLPEKDPSETCARVLRRFPDAAEAAPPAAVQRAMDGIIALLGGEESDLSTVTLDMEGVPAFHRCVYEVARTIAPGATLSYGELARRLGPGTSARAVGQALGRNPFAIVVPCHRVVGAGGKAGGFSARGGVPTKLRLLQLESAQARDTLFSFDRAGLDV